MQEDHADLSCSIALNDPCRDMDMWDSAIDDLGPGHLRRMTILRDGHLAAFGDVLEGWQSDEAFRAFFIRLLAEAPQNAFLWETPPVTGATVTRPFECVLVESRALASMRPDPHAFASHFANAEAGAQVVTFPNLGGDAFLVAPTPQAAPETYQHLAAFARNAPHEQQHAFWRAVATQVARHLSDRPLWLSTCGLGVAWLHARLDTWPKYYTYQPYRTVASEDGA